MRFSQSPSRLQKAVGLKVAQAGMASSRQDRSPKEVDVMARIKRYYICQELLPFEEDHLHEFKGHRNFTMADIPPYARCDGYKTRGTISRPINGFLNTGNGGTVYMGVLDGGVVGGLNLTQYQKDHIMVALDDLMASFSPPVEKHRYKIKYVPVVDNGASEDAMQAALSYNSSQVCDPDLRKRAHVIRTHKYCWCDKDAIAMFNHSICPALYVVEITIKPWDSNDPRNKNAIGEMEAPPIHQDEDGMVYFRRQASVTQASVQEVVQMAKLRVGEHYDPIIKDLQTRIDKAKKKYEEQHRPTQAQS